MKKNCTRRLLATLLAVIITVGSVPFTAIPVFAAITDTPDNGLRYSIENDEVTITGYTGSATELEIPAEIEGCPVTAIGAEAFKNCTGITVITIPESINKIEKYAFCGCSNLTEVHISDLEAWCNIDFGWEYYEYWVYGMGDPFLATKKAYTCSSPFGCGHEVHSGKLFVNDSPVTDMIFEDENVNINEFAFVNSLINTVTFKDGVKTIDIGVLVADCYSFDNQWDNDRGYYTEYLSAFVGVDLSRIVIPASVVSVSGLEYVSCDYIYYAGNYEQWCSVEGTDKLTDKNVICNTIVDSNVKYTYSEEIDGYVATSYFGDVANVKILSNVGNYSVKSIDPECFAGSNEIESIYIPGTIELIEDGALKNCMSLKTVTLEEGIIEIGDYAFYGCCALEEISFAESVEYVWSYAFANCTSLKRVVIPESVSVIEYKAFYKCKAIESVTYNGSPSGFEKVSVGNGNEILFEAGITYLSEDEPSYVFIPVPEGMRAEDCILYYVDGYGVATPVQVECVDGYFVARVQKVGYYILRNAEDEVPADPDIPDADGTLADLNGDGDINAKDANILKQIIAGSINAQEGSDLFLNSDLNGDGEINAKDANIMKQVIAGSLELN